MKKRKIFRAAALLASLVLAGMLLTGCTDDLDLSKGHVKLGSKTNTDNKIVAEVYALALKDAGYKVTRSFGLSEKELTSQINGKDLNMYPEYLSTGLTKLLKYDTVHDPDKASESLQTGLETMRDITALNRSNSNYAPGFAITKKAADKYHIQNTSDLQKYASKLRFLKTPETDSAEFDFTGAEKAYGNFRWKSTTESKKEDGKYKSLLSDEADACCARETDGYLTNDDLVFLKDDQSFWPAYQITAIVHNNILTHRTLLGGILNVIDEGLTTETMRKLNAKVDVDGESYKDVAKEYYKKIQDDLPTEG